MSTPSESAEIYCLKCRAKTQSSDVESVVMKNGQARAQGRVRGVRYGEVPHRLHGLNGAPAGASAPRTSGTENRTEIISSMFRATGQPGAGRRAERLGIAVRSTPGAIPRTARSVSEQPGVLDNARSEPMQSAPKEKG